MHRSLKVVLSFAAAAALACSGASSPSGPDERIPLEPGEVFADGTVRHTASFGGVLYLETTDGAIYLPASGIPPNLRHPGTKVRFFGRILDIPTTLMFGFPLEITWIGPR